MMIGLAPHRAKAADSPAVTASDGAALTLAQLFGKREDVGDASLSPDGKHLVFVAPGQSIDSYAVVMDLATHEMKAAAHGDGKPGNIRSCGWSSNTRIVCTVTGVVFDHDPPLPYSRTVAVDMDGKRAVSIGRRPGFEALRILQYDGTIIDWMQGDGTVLMARDYVPTQSTGTHIGSDDNGLGVDRVDTVTGRAVSVERPKSDAANYMTDGQGNVRMRTVEEAHADGTLTGVTTYWYRSVGDAGWKPFARTAQGGNEFTPIAVDGTRDLAYALKSLDGRDALYSVTLDGKFTSQLLVSHPAVDVDDVVTIGRRGRVIGATYTTDRRQIEYFDPDYKKLAASMTRALPGNPLISFISASADEQKLLIFVGSDTDPGNYYILDRGNHHMDELMPARAVLLDMKMAPMKSVSFKAADGTVIPAYLTLPMNGATKGLPAIVMPHGGPDYRDEWGFDWLVQFYAQRGYAVLQPEYRGSSGYGDAFFAHNAYHSWQTAMADICDAGRWLVKEGIADPDKLAIVGWSYGGYAALQANVVDPTLFKAIVAVAPVTDLGMLKAESSDYTNSWLMQRQIGSGEIVVQGSPARHADRIQAPVLIFHGDHDTNVGVAESRAMDAALRKAGKKSTLVVFPGLDHQLDDSKAREKLLDQSDAFLRATMHIVG